MTDGMAADFVEAMARAMARQEGFYKASNKALRNRNPGNIRPWEGCTLPVAGGMIAFPTIEAGWEQLRRQIRKNVFVRRLTMREFFGGKKDPKTGRVIYSGYAPAADGNKPDEYAAFVAGMVGILPVLGPDGKPIVAVDRVLADVIATWHQEPHLSAAQREEA